MQASLSYLACMWPDKFTIDFAAAYLQMVATKFIISLLDGVGTKGMKKLSRISVLV